MKKVYYVGCMLSSPLSFYSSELVYRRNFCDFSLSYVEKMVNLRVNTRVTQGERY